MKYAVALLVSALTFGGPLDDSSNVNADVIKNLPTTIVVKDGEVVGTLSEVIADDFEAETAIEEADFEELKVAEERSEDDYLADSSQDSYYYYRGYYRYSGPSRGWYGYYYNRYNYPYAPYYGWRGYNFYRYGWAPGYRPYYRTAPWRYRYYWF